MDKVSKPRNLFERPVGDKFKSRMVNGGKSKKRGGGEMAASIRQQLFGSGSSRVEHYISSSDQEEEFTSIKPRTKKKYTLAVKHQVSRERRTTWLPLWRPSQWTRRPEGHLRPPK